MPEPVYDDQDETVTTASGKKAVIPPPPGQSSPMYNAERSDGSGKDDSPYTTDFLKRFDPGATKGLTDSLASIERERGAAEQKDLGDLSGRMARDKAQMEKAFAAESQSANAIPPMWNADQERKDRETGPIESFASIGSIFGLLASAFTKTPLTSALNASAAAMTAINQHDEKAYQSAYDAWKENTSLAMKRFDMERTMFDDAGKFLDTDLATWKVKQLAIAAQFDNKKVIALLDAGMDDKVIEMQEAQVRAATGIQKARQDWEDYDVRRTIFKTETKAWDDEHKDAKPQERAKARLDILQGIGEGNKNIQEDLLRQYRLDNPGASAEDQAKFLMDHQFGRAGSVGGAPTKQKEIARRIADFKAKNPNASDDEIDAEYDKASREVADAAQPTMTPSKRIDVQRNVTQYGEATKTIDDAMQALETYTGAAGLAGKATRLGERVGNIFGSNQTDREQFMRNIEYLRTAAQRLLFDRSGRPLAADADRINDIIGGLSLGDTTANTIRSLKEVKERLQRLQKSQEDQLSGKWTPAGPGKSDAPSNGKPSWEEAPIVQPKVNSGTSQEQIPENASYQEGPIPDILDKLATKLTGRTYAQRVLYSRTHDMLLGIKPYDPKVIYELQRYDMSFAQDVEDVVMNK
jgi:hypothetical protein